MDTIYIYRGDTKTLQFNLSESGTGTAYSASGLVPWLTVKSAFDTGSSYLINVSGTVASTGSTITFNLTSGNTNQVGVKAAEMSLESGTGGIITAKQFWIEFKQDVRV